MYIYIHYAASLPLAKAVRRQNPKLDIFACRASKQIRFPRSVTAPTFAEAALFVT